MIAIGSGRSFEDRSDCFYSNDYRLCN